MLSRSAAQSGSVSAACASESKSGAVRARMPRATEEAVHRDYFVLA